MITQMLRGGGCRLGDPLPYRNFLFVTDLVELYRVVLARHERAAGQVFCTGPPNAVPIRTLAKMAARATSYHGTVSWGTVPRRAGEIYYLNSTHEKARRILWVGADGRLGGGARPNRGPVASQTGQRTVRRDSLPRRAHLGVAGRAADVRSDRPGPSNQAGSTR